MSDSPSYASSGDDRVPAAGPSFAYGPPSAGPAAIPDLVYLPVLPSGNPPEPPPPPERPRGRISGATALIWVAALFGLLFTTRAFGPAFLEQCQYALVRGRQRAEHETAGERLAARPLGELSRACALVSQRVSPSVVHITTRGVEEAEEPVEEFDDAHPFAPRAPPELRGQGSGVVMDEQGYVVTNQHVIRGATEIRVALSDGRRVPARIVGLDAATDLAVLQIDADGLTPAEWGDSDALEVGSLVWAVGSPFGLERSVTFGILSAKNRAGQAGTVYQDFLQTDAAVNPGNSGGPLVDDQGRVVGINTAIVGQAYQGISFAIPSNVAREVYARLRADGRVARGWLGVQLGEVDEEHAQALGLPQAAGALVVRVVDDAGGPSPARAAGIESGDVVLKWAGAPVSTPAALSRAVADTAIGTEVEVVVFREGAEVALKVSVGERPPGLN